MEFYTRGSVHRNSKLKKFNEMLQYVDIYLLLNYSTCFGPPSHPSSEYISFLAPRIVRSVPEAATTDLCTPDDGHDGRPKHVE